MKTRLLVPITLLLLLATLGLGAVEKNPLEEKATDDPAAEEALWQQAKRLFKPLPEVAADPDNPLNDKKVALGKMLYFDPRLSKDGNISCNSCHNLSTYGVDNLPTSPGDAGEHGARNSPTVLNAALHVAQFWDGRAADVEEQAGMPILNPVEMAIPHEKFLVGRLAEIPEYGDLFATAFPEEEQPLTYGNLKNAIGAFERTLLTPSRFDRYLRGERDVLTAEEKEGLRTFVGYGCVSCHNGVTVGGHIFRKFGLNEEYWKETGSTDVDEGRFEVTGEKADRYVFKVPSLRNVTETEPYFHDGSVVDLEQAIQVMVKLQVGIELGAEEVSNLVAFLETLTGQLPEEAMAPPPELQDVVAVPAPAE